ncbi:hypothetical protein FACS1894189_8070 [Planctomycetales bacterium]|nr:hypothetical protein FACS1894189_8070 [Planctomycetales bacterium]
MASFMEQFCKGFKYSGYCIVGEPTVFTDDKGTVQRFGKFLSAGKTFSLPVESDDELSALPKPGSMAYNVGLLVRRKTSKGMVGRMKTLILPGQKEWKEPTDEDFLGGIRFDGYGIVVLKRTTQYQGNTNRTLQVSTLGDVLVFQHIPEETYEKLPDAGQLYLGGHVDPAVVSSDRGAVDEFYPWIETHKVFDKTGAAPPPEANPSPTKAA